MLLLILYIEPLYLISRSKLNISGTVKERVAVVIASNRAANIQTLKERTDFSPITPYSLENVEMDLSGSSEDIIKKIYIEGLKLCDKVYCILLDDDVVFIYKDLKEVLFDNIISYNNDNNYVFDCSKKGFLRYNYKVNGNGSYCRIYSRYAVRQLIHCLPTCSLPVDVCLETCLSGFEEKRFLLAQHAGYRSSRW
ncbi:hypothetical protein BGZ51_006231 [Haplosporangium sp. Z 767]|nr:hypothetical protein BGZ50_006283 [Haplosporangium sp. Z 11]KAF9180393.1 hypothetical protein BGZ51_006231 [Haplosporangium sp. Z 767]